MKDYFNSTKKGYDETEFDEEPPEYEPRKPQTFPILNKRFLNTLTVYPSEESYDKYQEYKKDPNSLFVINENSAGHGLPLIESHTRPFSSKFLSIRRYVKPIEVDGLEQGFDKDKHYYDSCVIKKRIGLECSIYTLQFLNEQVLVFYHNVMPIIDYEYHGIVYRWVYQNKYTFGKFKFTLLQLGSQRGYSIVDSWDKNAGKLVSNHPLMKILALFSVKARRKQPELFHDAMAIGEVHETKRHGLHRTEVVLENNLTEDQNSIDVGNVVLVHIVVGVIIKRHQDILEERRRRAAQSSGGGASC